MLHACVHTYIVHYVTMLVLRSGRAAGEEETKILATFVFCTRTSYIHDVSR